LRQQRRQLAAGDRNRREEHDRKNIGEQAVDEADIDLVRQLAGWRGRVAPSGVRHAEQRSEILKKKRRIAPFECRSPLLDSVRDKGCSQATALFMLYGHDQRPARAAKLPQRS
jgi:hypothetical protein